MCNQTIDLGIAKRNPFFSALSETCLRFPVEILFGPGNVRLSLLRVVFDGRQVLDGAASVNDRLDGVGEIFQKNRKKRKKIMKWLLQESTLKYTNNRKWITWNKKKFMKGRWLVPWTHRRWCARWGCPGWPVARTSSSSAALDRRPSRTRTGTSASACRGRRSASQHKTQVPRIH